MCAPVGQPARDGKQRVQASEQKPVKQQLASSGRQRQCCKMATQPCEPLRPRRRPVYHWNERNIEIIAGNRF